MNRVSVPLPTGQPKTPSRKDWLPASRWHLSSRMVMGSSLIALLLCNLPGQLVTGLNLEHFLYWRQSFCIEARLEHGWPFTYLVRKADPRGFLSGELREPDCWLLWR